MNNPNKSHHHPKFKSSERSFNSTSNFADDTQSAIADDEMESDADDESDNDSGDE